jgi:hypothetical protein
MNTRRAIVTGVGPGTGRAVVQRLTQGGCEGAMVARSEERLRQFEAAIPASRAFPADVTAAAGLSNDGYPPEMRLTDIEEKHEQPTNSSKSFQTVTIVRDLDMVQGNLEHATGGRRRDRRRF